MSGVGVAKTKELTKSLQKAGIHLPVDKVLFAILLKKISRKE